MPETNTFDYSFVISAITLIVAIFSPVLVTVLNNIHSTKIKKIELKYEKQFSYYQKQQDVFNTFLKFASKQIESNYSGKKIEYIRSYHELLLYTPEECWEDFKPLHDAIISRNTTVATSKLSSVTKTLGRILQESDRKFPKL